MRNVFPILMICLVLTLGGGFAWLTHHPESPWLEKATTWPGVGPLAKRFRDAYLGPAPTLVMGEDGQLREGSPSEVSPQEPRAEPERIARKERSASAGQRDAARKPQVTNEPPPEPETSKPEPVNEPIQLSEAWIEAETRRFEPVPPPPPPRPSDAIDLTQASAWEWFLPGQPLAESIAPAVVPGEPLSSMAYLPIFDRDGTWAEVVYRGRRTWIDTSWKPPHSRRKAHRGIVRQRYEPVRTSDREQLEKARKILGIDRPVRYLGPYQLFTDIEDEELLDFLDLTARKAEDAYFARFARLPSGDPTRSIVLFAHKSDYQSYASNEMLANTGGHAGSGMLVFFAEDRPRFDLARTLVHEVAHLMNARALTRFLPPWLEEGTASVLGSVWMEDPIEAAVVVGRSADSRFTMSRVAGGTLHLGKLLETNQLAKLETLFKIEYELFHRPEIQSYAYSHSASFLRFLLDAEDGRFKEGFLKFLGKIAAGFGADSKLLLKLLDIDADELDLRYRAWLRQQVEDQKKRQAEEGWSDLSIGG